MSGPAASRARGASASVRRSVRRRVESRAACTAATALQHVDVDRAAAEAARLSVARNIHVDPMPTDRGTGVGNRVRSRVLPGTGHANARAEREDSRVGSDDARSRDDPGASLAVQRVRRCHERVVGWGFPSRLRGNRLRRSARRAAGQTCADQEAHAHRCAQCSLTMRGIPTSLRRAAESAQQRNIRHNELKRAPSSIHAAPAPRSCGTHTWTVPEQVPPRPSSAMNEIV